MATAAAAKDEQTAHRFAKIITRRSSNAWKSSKKKRKPSRTISAMSRPRPRATASDIKALRVVVRMRKEDIDERKEHEAILETYLHARSAC